MHRQEMRAVRNLPEKNRHSDTIILTQAVSTEWCISLALHDTLRCAVLGEVGPSYISAIR